MFDQDPVDAARLALALALVISVPILGAGLLVGLAVSLFQAVTQIQDQALSSVPRIIVMVVAAMALLSWIAVRLVDFAVEMFGGFA